VKQSQTLLVSITVSLSLSLPFSLSLSLSLPLALTLMPHNLIQGLVNSSRLTDPGALSVFDLPVTAGPKDQV
jgi:hypothetical protein